MPISAIRLKSNPNSHQDRERADAGRRQRRQDGERMDVALVENAEDQVDDDERRQDQQRHGAERLLERLRGALEARVEGRRRTEFDHRLLHGVGRLAERHALGEVEADGDRRELALVADRQRPDRHAGPVGERRQRHLVAGGRRFDVDLVQRVEAALQLRQDLQDHVIAVELGEILRDLALAERVVERVVDQLRLDAVARGRVAVDRQRQRRALGLLVGGDVAQLRQCLHLGQDLRRPFVQLVEIGVLQRVFELRPRRPAAEPDVLRRLQEEPGALDLVELGTQPRDDLLGATRRARCAASA